MQPRKQPPIIQESQAGGFGCWVIFGATNDWWDRVYIYGPRNATNAWKAAEFRLPEDGTILQVETLDLQTADLACWCGLVLKKVGFSERRAGLFGCFYRIRLECHQGYEFPKRRRSFHQWVVLRRVSEYG